MRKNTSIPRWGRSWTLLAALVLIVAAALSRRLIDRTRLRHFQTVTPGVLYRAAWPRPRKLEALIRRYDLRTVVNLCLPREGPDGRKWSDEAEVCDALGVELVRIPLRGNTPPSPQQAEQWLNIVTSPERRPVLVHCAQGVIRTNAMVAVYRIGVLGEDNKAVLSRLPDFGHDLFAPKRQKLNDFILSWKSPEVSIDECADALGPFSVDLEMAPQAPRRLRPEID